MRGSTLTAVLIATLATVLASHAQASNFILTLTGGSSASQGSDPACMADPKCVVANASDTLSFDILVSADSQGVSAWGFTVQWDSDLEDELDLVTADEPRTTGMNALPFDVTSTDGVSGLNHLSEGFGQAPMESTTAMAGRQRSFEAAANLPFPNGIFNETFLVGILRFHVKAPSGSVSDVEDVQVGFFDTSADTMGRANATPFTPGFDNFKISAPEPSMTLLAFAGIGAVAALSLHRRRAHRR